MIHRIVQFALRQRVLILLLVGRSRRLLGVGGRKPHEKEHEYQDAEDRKSTGFGHESILSQFLLV